jgi:hypothetical protein
MKNGERTSRRSSTYICIIVGIVIATAIHNNEAKILGGGESSRALMKDRGVMT